MITEAIVKPTTHGVRGVRGVRGARGVETGREEERERERERGTLVVDSLLTTSRRRSTLLGVFCFVVLTVSELEERERERERGVHSSSTLLTTSRRRSTLLGVFCFVVLTNSEFITVRYTFHNRRPFWTFWTCPNFFWTTLWFKLYLRNLFS